MRFFTVKKDPIPCKLCKTSIAKGELCARTFNKNHITGIGYSQYFHPECYQKNWNYQFEKAWEYWKEQALPLSGGRPRKHTDSARANALSTLQSYHRKRGHTLRVFEIQQDIDNLKGGN